MHIGTLAKYMSRKSFNDAVDPVAMTRDNDGPLQIDNWLDNLTKYVCWRSSWLWKLSNTLRQSVIQRTITWQRHWKRRMGKSFWGRMLES